MQLTRYEGVQLRGTAFAGGNSDTRKTEAALG